MWSTMMNVGQAILANSSPARSGRHHRLALPLLGIVALSVYQFRLVKDEASTVEETWSADLRPHRFLKYNLVHRLQDPSTLQSWVEHKWAKFEDLEADGGDNIDPPAVPDVDAHAVNLGNFFIDIQTFTEGISGWRGTLNQVLAVIDVIPGATLVEPCMINGRLLSCTSGYPPDVDGSPVPVSEVFDFDWVLQPDVDGKRPAMVRYQDFVRYMNKKDKEKVNHFPLCLKASQVECPQPFLSRFGANELDPSQDPDQISIYTINMCWWGRCAFELDKLFLQRYNHPRPVEASGRAALPAGKPLKIHPKNIQTVKDVLALANIDDYSLIHWRAERKNLDYLQCAQYVVQAKNNMMSSDKNHPFLLMTSIDEDVHKQWNGELLKEKWQHANGSPGEALGILKENGFVRFDQLLQEAKHVQVQDPGMLGVYDLVLTTMAEQFSTCSNGPGIGKGAGIPEGCSDEQRGICHHCNYIGKFARMAMDMRLESGADQDSTKGCWPVSKINEAHPLHPLDGDEVITH